MHKTQELVKTLRKQAAQYFKSKGCATARCGYILASRADWPKNIILRKVADYIESKKRQAQINGRSFPLHKYIHHGLSSQACLFNLLGPLLVDGDYVTLKGILELSGLPLSGAITSAEFEFEDRKIFAESRGQPSSIDLHVKTDDDEAVFAEFKFTEVGFGSCSLYRKGRCDGANPRNDLNSCCLHKMGRTYMALMNRYGLLGGSDSCPFTEFYQAYRVLLCALENDGCFLLICDERNPAFWGCGEEVTGEVYVRFRELLPPGIADKVFVLSIQRIVEHLEKHLKPSWLLEFRRKYL